MPKVREDHIAKLVRPSHAPRMHDMQRADSLSILPAMRRPSSALYSTLLRSGESYSVSASEEKIMSDVQQAQPHENSIVMTGTVVSII